jgi:hypothetical protein
MSESRQEEVLSMLSAIASILAFGFGFNTWGWIFLVKAVFDSLAAIYLGFKEVKKKLRNG